MAHLMGDANGGSVGRLGGVIGGNRSMTAAELASLYSAGIPEADRGASALEVMPGTSSTLARKADFALSGEDATHILTDTATGIRFQSDTTSPQLIIRVENLLNAGENYLLEIEINNHVSGSIKSDAFATGNFGANGVFKFELAANVTVFTITRGSTNVDLIIGRVSIKRAGQTTNLQPSAIQLSPGQWLESANDKHIILPDGTRQGQVKTQGQVRGVNTWAASLALQYIGYNANMVPVNTVLRLYAKASVAASFNIGDQTDPDRYGAAVALTTEFAPVAVLKHESDGTNRKLTITPTASYTGTVTTMWRVEAVG